MINIRIDKPYQLITEWSDISFEKSIEMGSMIEQMPLPFKQRFFSEEKQDDYSPEDVANYLEFKINYISALNDIPKDVLRQVKPKNGVDINYIFEMCCKFLAYPQPNDIELSECLKLDGVKMYPVKRDVDSMGRPSNFQKADFATYAVGMTIQNVIDKLILNNDFRTEQLTLLAACLFRPMVKTRKWFKTTESPEPYSYELVRDRSLKLNKAPASEIYGAYFFLLKHQQKLLSDTQNSLKNRLDKKMKSPLLKLNLIMASLKWSIVGSFMGMRLRVTECLTKKE